MSDVKTVAYIPNTIKGHGVLIALACDQIAISPDAELGNAAIDEDASRPINPNILIAYQDIANAKRTVPLAIALGMVDPPRRSSQSRNRPRHRVRTARRARRS